MSYYDPLCDWEDAHHATAQRQGWGLFETLSDGHPPIELQRDDDLDLFDNDEGAWLHVVRTAQAGDIACASALHLLAVESPDEHHAIMDHRRNLIHKMRCLLGGKPYCPEEDH